LISKYEGIFKDNRLYCSELCVAASISNGKNIEINKNKHDTEKTDQDIDNIYKNEIVLVIPKDEKDELYDPMSDF